MIVIPLIPIPLELVTEGSKCAGENRIDIAIESTVAAS
jgi:hypothetical protein